MSENADPVFGQTYTPNLLGFKDVVPNLGIRHKQGGETTLGKVIRPNQQAFLDRVERYRNERRPIQWFEIKIRQFVSMTTVAGAVMVGDSHSNAGWNTVVTAHQQDSLDQIDLMFKYFYGRTKKQGKEQGRASRFADYLYESMNGSMVTLQLADKHLGRSGALQGLLVSEAHYIENFEEAWRSAQPSLATAFWRMVIMETTIERGVSNKFRDIVMAAHEGKYPEWDVHFTSWRDVPELCDQAMTASKIEKLMLGMTEYEKLLRQKHKCSWGQIQWHRNTRVNGMFGDLEAMMEAYPTDFDEAMLIGIGIEFFSRDALKFHADNCREPMARLSVGSGGLVRMAADASRMQPHVEMWEPPSYGARYIIGADCADAEERVAVHGSENYAIVANMDTGDVVAQWHGYAPSHEFAQVLDAMARRYNNALVNPEYNNAGKAVMDALRVTCKYSNLARREQFRYGVAVNTLDGHFGFDTRGTTRQLLIDRLQQCVNRRLVSIPAANLVDQLKEFGNRNGRKAQRAKNVENTPDDGCIALGLTCFGHDRMVSGHWQPKAPFVPVLTDSAPKRRVPGYLISHDDRKQRRRVFDPTMNCWVRA